MNPQQTSWDRITAIATIFIALCALYISVWQSVIYQKHNRLSVKPKLDIRLNWMLDRTSGLFISNRGLGPGRIKSISVFLDGKPLNPINGLQQIGKTLIGTQPNIVESDTLLSAHSLFEGDIIEKGEKLIFLGIPAGAIKHINVNRFNAFFTKRVKVIIVYCSLYGECEKALYPISSQSKRPS